MNSSSIVSNNKINTHQIGDVIQDNEKKISLIDKKIVALAFVILGGAGAIGGAIIFSAFSLPIMIGGAIGAGGLVGLSALAYAGYKVSLKVFRSKEEAQTVIAKNFKFTILKNFLKQNDENPIREMKLEELFKMASHDDIRLIAEKLVESSKQTDSEETNKNIELVNSALEEIYVDFLKNSEFYSQITLSDYIKQKVFGEPDNFKYWVSKIYLEKDISTRPEQSIGKMQLKELFKEMTDDGIYIKAKEMVSNKEDIDLIHVALSEIYLEFQQGKLNEEDTLLDCLQGKLT